jgi:DNA-binding GntR family transcriptional regulator
VKWNEEHDLLIDAVRRRRTDRAVSLLKHHLAETEKCVLSALKHSTPRTSP